MDTYDCQQIWGNCRRATCNGTTDLFGSFALLPYALDAFRFRKPGRIPYAYGFMPEAPDVPALHRRFLAFGKSHRHIARDAATHGR